jgi:hypothetical protein
MFPICSLIVQEKMHMPVSLPDAMTPPNALPADLPQLDELDWNSLIDSIIAGAVVPVIGQELLISNKDGQEESLYDLWGRVLAEQVRLPLPEQDGTPALYQVTSKLLMNKNPNTVAQYVHGVVKQPWPLPDSLRKLAEIQSFSLYVTTTIDHLLENALEETRPQCKGKLRKIGFALHADNTHNDLPEDFANLPTPTIFHVFGFTSPFANAFAKTEDDLIDFSASLLDWDYAPKSFYDYLQNKTILLLGCSFPDWLGRFFVRALNAHYEKQTINIYYVSGHHEEGLENYLRRKQATVLAPYSPVSFVDELYRRWQKRHAESQSQPSETIAETAQPGPLKRGAVFLSYASEDRDTVRRIQAQLEAADVDTWMDESGLEPGVQFQHVIRGSIRDASCFIAFISNSLEGQKKRFLWKEWKWAEDESLNWRKGQQFLQAVVIDDTPSGASFVDPPYSELHWTRLENGLLPDSFVQILSQGVRSFRRSK